MKALLVVLALLGLAAPERTARLRVAIADPGARFITRRLHGVTRVLPVRGEAARVLPPPARRRGGAHSGPRAGSPGPPRSSSGSRSSPRARSRALTAPCARSDLRPARRTRGSGGRVRYAVLGQGMIAQVAVLPPSPVPDATATSSRSSPTTGQARVRQRYGVGGSTPTSSSTSAWPRERWTPSTSLPSHLPPPVRRGRRPRRARALRNAPAVTEEDCEEIVPRRDRNKVKLMTAYRLHFERAHLERSRSRAPGAWVRSELQLALLHAGGGRNIRLQAEYGEGPSTTSASTASTPRGLLPGRADRGLRGERQLGRSALPRGRRDDGGRAALPARAARRLHVQLRGRPSRCTSWWDPKGTLRLEPAYTVRGRFGGGSPSGGRPRSQSYPAWTSSRRCSSLLRLHKERTGSEPSGWKDGRTSGGLGAAALGAGGPAGIPRAVPEPPATGPLVRSAATAVRELELVGAFCPGSLRARAASILQSGRPDLEGRGAGRPPPWHRSCTSHRPTDQPALAKPRLCCWRLAPAAVVVSSALLPVASWTPTRRCGGGYAAAHRDVRNPEGARAYATGVRLDREELQPPKDEGDPLPRARRALPLVALRARGAVRKPRPARRARGGTSPGCAPEGSTTLPRQRPSSGAYESTRRMEMATRPAGAGL
jgi:hypothetical protein